MSITITCRTPSDLVAAAVGVLGFVPQESVVMLTFGSGSRFHARTDLQHHDVALVCDALLSPVRRHGVTRVAFIVFAGNEADLDPSGRLLAHLVAEFTSHGVDVVTRPLIIVNETVHHPDGTTERCDWRSSPAIAGLILEGRPIEASRDALKDRVRQTSNAFTDGPGDVATALLDLVDGEKRDPHLRALRREISSEQVEFWLAVTRQAPGAYGAAPAALSGFAAWLCGDGALAWICVDHAQDADPGNRLAQILAELLTRCVDPSTWDQLRLSL